MQIMLAVGLNGEPIVEVTQIKGDSETRSDFSPDDEFADFENYDHYIQQGKSEYKGSTADYIRPALKKGLAIRARYRRQSLQIRTNWVDRCSLWPCPHAEEGNFLGKMAKDSTPETKERVGSVSSSNGWNMSASGLAAVWAEENTREAIYAAFKRKEVYATSGPRLRVQMFAGWDFPENAAIAEDFGAIGNQYGVSQWAVI